MVLDVGRVKHLGDLMHKSYSSNGTAIASNWRLSADGLTNVVWSPESAGSVSYGSNSNDVGNASAAGASSLVSRTDHVHRGVHLITSNGSNTLYGDVNLQAGVGMALGVAAQTITLTNTGVPGPAGSGGSGTDNWLIEIDVLTGAHGNTNWSTMNVDSAEVYCADIESSGAQNDERYWNVGVTGGTWDFTLMHFKGANRGIYDVQIDGVSIGTIDGYAAGATRNVISSITGVSITAGKRKIALKMTSKNASSSSYFGTVQHIQLRRTA